MAEKLNVSTKDAEKSIKLKIASFCDLIGKDGAEAAINDLKTPDPIVHEQADVLLKGLLEEYNYLYNVSTSSPQMVIPLRRSRNELIRFFIDLPERFFRSNLVRSISEAMWKFSKLGPVSDDINLMDIRGLALARRFLSAQTLTHRLVGIQEISNYITDFHYYVQQSKGRNKRSAQQLGDRLAQWILEQHILQLIFCTSIHNEVLQRSCLLVQFLCNMGYMDTSHITLMWDAAKDTFCCRAVYEVFQSIVGDLNGECLVYLFDLVYASMMQSKPDEWNDVLIKLAHDVQRNVWTSTSVKELSQGSEERVSIESSSPENEEDDDSDDEEENSEANANAKKIIFQRESTRHKFVHDLLKDDSLDDSDEYDESTTSGSSVESLDADDEQSSAGDMSEIRWIEGERRASTVNRVTPESPATASPINDQMEAELILMRNIEANRICANEANKKAKTFLRNSEEVVPPIQASDEDKSKMLMAAKMLLLGDP